MGFLLQVGHPSDMLEHPAGEEVAGELRAALGEGLPLGVPEERWSTDDTVIGEMGWSWWQEMQELVAQEIGRTAAPHTLATEAWYSVYVDARVPPGVLDRGRVRPPRPPRRPGPIARFLANRRARRGDPAALVETMIAQFGPSRGDAGLLKVGDLRALRAELERAIRSLGHEPEDGAMNALLESYYGPEMDRCDEDTGLQCLAHAWVATSKAVELNAPLWLIK